jgi:hypothetical protein
MTDRFDILSRSASGLSYVRERKLGVVRVLTADELSDFDDPAPCPECSEQFGCEHFNCAGEAMLTDAEIAAEVPAQWLAFAQECGVSRGDLARLKLVECVEGEYRLAGEAEHDVRALELVLLINEQR